MTPEHKREFVITMACAGLLAVITVLIVVTGWSDLK